MSKSRSGALIVLVVAMVLATLIYQGPGNWRDTAPDVIRIGVLPDESAVVLEQRYAPLIRFLSDEVGIPFKLVVPADYSDLLTMFGRGDVDLALFGGLTFLLAHDQYGAVPLVMRDVDLNFRSYFIARSDGGANDKRLTDYKGAKFAFGSSLSTSGHLMPRLFLEEEGINAELFFESVEYSGAHDKTAEWIRDGRVDFGVANSQVVEKMLSDGRLKARDIQVVWITPPYPDYVFAARGELNMAMQDEILSSFLSLGSLDGAHKQILTRIGATGFLPAVLADFDELSEVARSRNLL